MKDKSFEAKLKALRKHFTPGEWVWITEDTNCQNVITNGGYFDALFYCRFRVPRRLRSGAWAD